MGVLHLGGCAGRGSRRPGQNRRPPYLTAYHRPPPFPSSTIPPRVTTTRVPDVSLMGRQKHPNHDPGPQEMKRAPGSWKSVFSDAVAFITPSISGNLWRAASGTCMLLLGDGVHEAELVTHHPMALMGRRASRGAQSAVRPPQGPRGGRSEAVSAAILPYGVGCRAFFSIPTLGWQVSSPPSPACLLSTSSGSDCAVFAPPPSLQCPRHVSALLRNLLC